MAKKYRYELQKGSKHIHCPNCGKKTFKPYIDVETGELADITKYGRCERIHNCQYFMYPDSKLTSEDWINYEIKPIIQPKIIQPDTISREIVEKTFNRFRENVFFIWLVKLFGKEKAFELQEKYNIGTAKKNGTIFWQQDREGRFRTGKIIYYGIDGKRLKDRNSWYVHNKSKKNFNLMQVFFGEHLMRSDTPIALCESEKTAILMSIYKPEFTWLSAGGSSMLNLYRLSRLFRLDYVFADNGQFEKWQQQTAMFKGRQMDVSVNKAFREGKLNQGDDILDLYLLNANINNNTNSNINNKTEKINVNERGKKDRSNGSDRQNNGQKNTRKLQETH